jgi:cytochrome c oxidase subunit 3
MSLLVEERRKQTVPPPPIPPEHGRGDGWTPGGRPSSFPVSKAQIGLWVFLTAVIMLFAGLTSAYIVLRGAPDWQNINVPALLWGDTVVLLASSISIEFARRAIRRNQIPVMNQWLVVSGILGFVFLVGQVVAWRQLVNAGVYLQSTLHSSFLFVLTGVHGVHLLGGIVALMVVLGKARIGYLTQTDHEPLKLCATYWHFMDGLWIYLFVLLILA